AKAANFDTTSARLDYALCILWFGMIYWETDGAASVLMRAYRTGFYVPPEVVIWATRLWVGITIGVSVYYLFHIVRRYREGHPPSVLKLALLGISGLFYVYAFRFTSSHLVAYTLFEGYHDIQYLAIVWVFNRNRVDKDPNAGAFTKFLFRRRAILIVLYVMLCLGFGSYRLFADQIADETLAKTALGLVTGVALVHFYFDGFIWRIRESSTSETLDVKHDQTVRKPLVPLQFRHALLWLVLGLPVIGLGTVETMSGSSSDEVDQRAYEAVLEIRPGSHKTHFMLSQLHAKNGNRELALEHARKATEYRPSYDVNDVQYVDLLMEDFEALTDEQLIEIAACYENAARTRPGLKDIFDNWGIVLDKLTRYSEAERAFERAINADPGKVESRNSLAQVLVKQQKFQKAADVCIETARLFPNDVQSHSLAATLLMQLGTPDLAMPYFDHAVQLDPSNVQNRINYALALATVQGPLQNPDEAFAIVNELVRKDESLDVAQTMNLVQICVAAGQFDTAIQVAEKASVRQEVQGSSELARNLRAAAEQIRAAMTDAAGQ
ncbi:MAG: tetratricopeptide repeat protein, partial [Planctomycetales bacterium]|nr:tetratricopeptide repeat protein [Planctomycetales bacterium]